MYEVVQLAPLSQSTVLQVITHSQRITVDIRLRPEICNRNVLRKVWVILRFPRACRKPGTMLHPLFVLQIHFLARISFCEVLDLSCNHPLSSISLLYILSFAPLKMLPFILTLSLKLSIVKGFSHIPFSFFKQTYYLQTSDYSKMMPQKVP